LRFFWFWPVINSLPLREKKLPNIVILATGGTPYFMTLDCDPAMKILRLAAMSSRNNRFVDKNQRHIIGHAKSSGLKCPF
jgi:hypothetical protein